MSVPASGTGRGVIYPPGRAITVQPDDYTTTNSYVVVPGSLIDTAPIRAENVNYNLHEVGGVHGVTFKVQMAVVDNDADYVDFKAYDADAAQRSGVDIAVAASGRAHAIVPILGGVGAFSAFRFFRVLAKSTISGQAGSGRVRGFAK